MLITGVRTLTTALAAPTLSSSISGSTVTLNWAPPVPTGQSIIAGYRVYKSAALGGPYTQMGGSLPSGQTSFNDTISATSFYAVEAFDQFVTGRRSVPAQCAPLGSGQINHNPGHRIHVGGEGSFNGVTDFTDNGTLVRNLDTNKVVKGLITTFLPGQCEGAFGDYSAWFTIVQQLLTYCQGLGLDLSLNINITGNVGKASVPSYMLNNTTYGQVVSGTGYQGGLFSGPSAGSSTGTVNIVRHDIPATMARIAAMVTALYNEFGTAIYAVNPTYSEYQNFTNYVPQMSSATIVNTFAAAGGFFDQLRAGAPKMRLRTTPSFLNQGDFATLFAATDRNFISVGVYDFSNEVPVPPKTVVAQNPAQAAFRGGQYVNKVFQPNYPGLIDRRLNVAGRDFFGHVGADELGQRTSSATVPPAAVGNGTLPDIWAQSVLMQCADMDWYNNRSTGPLCNATSIAGYTPPANYSGATWGNLIGFLQTVTTQQAYPSTWP